MTDRNSTELSHAERPLRILQVSTFDRAGGAEKVAWDLFQGYRQRGHDAWLAVGRKRTDDPGVFEIPNSTSDYSWQRPFRRTEQVLQPWIGRIKGIGHLALMSRKLRELPRSIRAVRGREDFSFPGTQRLLSLTPTSPDLIHMHNLHGGYFDLRELPRLGSQVPLFMTLHDAWSTTGHCAHSFGCERWKIGCGHCPDLKIYPPIRRDSTRTNWQRKARIWKRSVLHVAAPSQWLLDRARVSMLAPALRDARVIHNGIDLNVFQPGDRTAARELLRLPQDVRIVMITTNYFKANPWKDYSLVAEAFQKLKSEVAERLLCLVIGDDAPDEVLGRVAVRNTPHITDPRVVADYYRAADLYLHPAKVDTFPNTVLEAMACGTPVVATAVGGIPEQVLTLHHPTAAESLPQYDRDSATGQLVPPADPDRLARGVEDLLTQPELLRQLGDNGARRVANHFSLDRCIDQYLSWYREMLAEWSPRLANQGVCS